jgi:3-hydroxybutyryl-CoA dehydrogenase
MAKHLGIVGVGATGIELARRAALARIEVSVYDVNATVLRQALERLKTRLRNAVTSGEMSELQFTEAFGRLHPRTRLIELNTSDIVVEAVIEDLRIKKDLFKHLEVDTKPKTTLVSTTSSLSVTAIASATTRPENVVGFHIAGSAASARLAEIVCPDRCSRESVDRTFELARQLGFIPVRVKDSPGFLFDRISPFFCDEALRILEEHVADIDQIDRIVKTLGGFSSGPFEVLDASGPETVLAIRRALFEQTFGEPRFRPHPLLQRMADSGQKSYNRKAQ